MTGHSEGLAQGLLEAMSEALYVVDRKRTITYWNRAAEEVTGFAAADVVGKRCRDGVLNHVDEAGRSMCGSRCPLLGTMRDGQPREAVVYAHHRDGHRFAVAVKAAALRDDTGKISGAVEVFHDDSRCQALAGQVVDAERRALTDPLTGLGNRRLLTQALQRLEDEQVRYARPFAVLFADIDHFKSVNDRHGHEVGDEVLRLVGATLRSCTRPSDVVGRWGGEEFLILAPAVDDEQARALSERMRRLVGSTWIEAGGLKQAVSLSVGVALSATAEPADRTVVRADRAMLAAKTGGRNRTVVATTQRRPAASKETRKGA